MQAICPSFPPSGRSIWPVPNDSPSLFRLISESTLDMIFAECYLFATDESHVIFRRLCLRKSQLLLRRSPVTQPKWRNGRRDGFKIHCPQRTCGFESHLRHSLNFRIPQPQQFEEVAECFFSDLGHWDKN